MRRFWLIACICACAGFAQSPPAEQEPPEEDIEVERKTEYVLNPLQAAKEMKVGQFYFKKRSYKAAARRFEEATKWDPNLAEAWLRMGEAYAKDGDEQAAKAAWQKFLELQPDGKQAAIVRKKLEKR